MSGPRLSVIICTRERPDDLERCLAALARQTVGPLDIVVVDNAPRTSRTWEVAERAGARYVLEPRPGLNRARNAGLRSAISAGSDRIAYSVERTQCVATEWGSGWNKRSICRRWWPT